EGVAGAQFPALQPLAEPAHALRRAAMGETVRYREAASLLLHAVVTHRARRRQPFLHVAGLEHLARAMRMVGPHPRQAVGLQLEPNRQQVGLSLGLALAGLLHLVRDPQQVLYVMTHFVRDHVGLCEIALRPVALAGLVEERQTEIDLAVGRTVERPHLGLTDAAAA